MSCEVCGCEVPDDETLNKALYLEPDGSIRWAERICCDCEASPLDIVTKGLEVLLRSIEYFTRPTEE